MKSKTRMYQWLTIIFRTCNIKLTFCYIEWVYICIPSRCITLLVIFKPKACETRNFERLRQCIQGVLIRFRLCSQSPVKLSNSITNGFRFFRIERKYSVNWLNDKCHTNWARTVTEKALTFKPDILFCAKLQRCDAMFQYWLEVCFSTLM